MNSMPTAPRPQSSSDLPVCGVPTYLRGLAYLTKEMATKNDPRVRILGTQLLVLQSPTLTAIADAMKTSTSKGNQ